MFKGSEKTCLEIIESRTEYFYKTSVYSEASETTKENSQIPKNFYKKYNLL